jgi:hypothetical protein
MGCRLSSKMGMSPSERRSTVVTPMLRQQWATVPQVLATQSLTEKPEVGAEAKSEDQ